MNIKLTDLLDDYEECSVSIPMAAGPSARRIEQLVLQKAGLRRPHVRPVRRVLLAAALSALFAAAAVAGAFSLIQLSRADLGVTDPASIPEYTEYEAPPASESVCLVSSFCAGKRLIAYAEVPNVTKDMANAYQAAWDTYGQSLWSCRAKPYSIWAEQLSYDTAAQSALLRIELAADEDFASGEIAVELCFDTLEDGTDAAEKGLVTTGPVFAAFTIPVSPSDALTAAPELPVSSGILGESAVLKEITLDAGTLYLTMQAPTLEAYLSARGGDALDTLVNGYFGADSGTPDMLDAQVAYRRSWNQTANELFTDAVLCFADGTEQSLSALFQNQACFFSPALETTQEGAGIYAFEAALSSPVSLESVRAIKVSGQEILLPQ